MEGTDSVTKGMLGVICTDFFSLPTLISQSIALPCMYSYQVIGNVRTCTCIMSVAL